jgi:hypothetical protein
MMDFSHSQVASQQRPKPRKQRRISRACDFCHQRSIRCTPSREESDRCQNCVDFDVSCTYRRPMKKRGLEGPKAATGEMLSSERESQHPVLEEHPDTALPIHPTRSYIPPIVGRPETGIDNGFTFPLSPEYQNLVLSKPNKIADLVSVYFAVIYPM